MPAQINLVDAIEQIIDGVVAMLEAETAPGGALEDVKTVVRGDKRRGKPVSPAIWVFPDTAENNNQQAALAETWTMPIILTPVIKSVGDPDAGYREATSLAARARSVLLTDRTLGLRAFVQDTRSASFEPSAPWHSDVEKGLHSAVCVMNVVFRVLE